MARLIGVAAAVHVGEVEAADGAERVRVRDEPADRGGGADLGDEDVPGVAPNGVVTSSGRTAQLSSKPVSSCSGSDEPSIVKSDKCRMKRARRVSPSAWRANNSMNDALIRTSGLSGLEGRQETDQYQRSVVRGMGMQVAP